MYRVCKSYCSSNRCLKDDITDVTLIILSIHTATGNTVKESILYGRSSESQVVVVFVLFFSFTQRMHGFCLGTFSQMMLKSKNFSFGCVGVFVTVVVVVASGRYFCPCNDYQILINRLNNHVQVRNQSI